MDLGLKNKKAAISGASQGIGFAIAEALAQEGCDVAIAARGTERLAEASTRLEQHGSKVVSIVADLGSEAGCRLFIEGAANVDPRMVSPRDPTGFKVRRARTAVVRPAPGLGQALSGWRPAIRA
jgi:NAD(P)-dependent dehydrogenase (short-subunit alcohol dehydrogenase family)